VTGAPRAKRRERLPVVLTRHEVRALVEQLSGTKRIMALLLYGAGLRLNECLALRVQDIDFGMRQIVVRGGKGDKDRVTMLPASVESELRAHLEQVRGDGSGSSPRHRAIATPSRAHCGDTMPTNRCCSARYTTRDCARC